MFGPQNLPLIVDLDGTLILNDSSKLMLKRYLMRGFGNFMVVLSWALRGSAYVKQELARRVPISKEDFQYNERLIEALLDEKQQGRKIVLATGTDFLTASQVVRHLDLFDEIIASDGRSNCISFKKAEVLNQRFGRGHYVYVGNSTQDYAVWMDSAHAVAVNAPATVRKKLRYINVSQRVFEAS